MSRLEPIPEPWFSFLKELDELATTTVSLHCIGGFVVTALRAEPHHGRLDVLEVCPKSAGDAFAKVELQGRELHKKYKVYLDQVGVTQPPYDYESRLQEMFPGAFRNFHLMALDPYDLALTKLERNIERTAVMCDIWRALYLSTWRFSRKGTRPSYALI
jgi:hypothetical protein